MTNRVKASWKKASSRFISKPHLDFGGAGWADYKAKLLLASANDTMDAEPFWVGLELAHRSSGYREFLGVQMIAVTGGPLD